MASGQAHGENRRYQEFCRDALRRLRPEIEYYSGDGIDVPFEVGGTTWTIDIALKTPRGQVIVAECRRRTEPLKQDAVAAFAHKVELLRKGLGLQVAGLIFTKRHAQLGAVKACTWEGIQLAVCEQEQPLNAFSLVFYSYDAKRESRLRKGQVYAAGEIAVASSLTMEVIRHDGTREGPFSAK